ncbi:MAG: VCBS repeat-containing protein [Leptolyngbya sp. SIO1E4]|nr:VCBS repeat-containing protein [Leptolyngbya sp. SIO1E4]
MSNKSGTSAQVISLPSGGGALQGIGETFSPDLFTGTGNFSVPISLPPGRNGFQPELSLVYSTGNGNGPFGSGWALSVPGVMRKTSKGIPRYQGSDTFVLSGAEDLVPVEEIEGVTRYRPRTEGLFARIEHHHQPGKEDFWKVWSKDGLISYYGTPKPADAESDWEDPAAIAHPDPLKQDPIFAWKLSKTVDPFGNQIRYEYERDRTTAGPHDWNQLYLKRVRYGDYGDGPSGPVSDPRQNLEFLVSVNFEYEDRPDAFSAYRAGFEMRTRKRCTNVVVRIHAEEYPAQIVRSYDFVYLDERSALADLPLNGMSLLNQVKVTGHDGDLTESLPPLEFGYTQFSPATRTFEPVTGPDIPTQSLANANLEMADLFGNGLPDLIQMNGTVRYWRNLGNGSFDRPREMREAPANVALADSGVQLLDANGDGRVDLLVTQPGIAGYYPTRPQGLWDKRSFRRQRQAPSFNLEDPEIQLVDLDGDGVTDAIRSGSRLECFFNHPLDGWKTTRQVPRRPLEEFPNVNFSDPRVKWGDMVGDGLQAIALIHDGNVEYWPNLGYGNWGKRVSMRNSPRFPDGYDPRRILLGDVDGDGLADIVYVGDRSVTLWINQSGNRWSDPIVISGTPPVANLDAVRLDDLLGTGIRGVLWSADARSTARPNYFFLDFTGRVKPYLLNRMENHMGAETRVAYVSSTVFYQEDEKRPETRWKTTLPFPVQVVHRVEVIDRISRGKLTTEYRYRHGYWDGAEREFRGFGLVEQRDTETFEDYNQTGLHGTNWAFEAVDGDRSRFFSPPTLTKTWFHQGPVGDEFGDWQEIDHRDEYWPGDPVLLERPQDIQDFLKGLPRRDKRDALRTLRGQVLRTELYALDGSDRADRPYTVTESISGIREESPVEERNVTRHPEAPTNHRIFFPFGLAQRTTQWERGDDPMIQFSFSDDYDDYGMARMQMAIAVPRGRDFLQPATDAEPFLATVSTVDYIYRDEADLYRVDRVARSNSYEVINDGTGSLWELKAAIASRTAQLNLLGQSLIFYDGPAYEGLPYGEIGRYGMPVRTETLVMTPEMLQTAYRSGEAVLSPPEMPPYLNPDGVTWPEEYPQAFRNELSEWPELAGYVFHTEAAGSPYATGYFVVGDRTRYDFQTSADGTGRGLALGMQDPLGREMTVTYDRYDLLPESVTDALGLTMQARYDYRIMQPFEVIDPNRNRQRFGFTPLGLTAWAAATGKENSLEGDTPEQPSTWFEYDFMAYEDRQEPIWVHSIVRQEHRWELVAEANRQRVSNNQPELTEQEIADLFPADEVNQFPERFIQSREYSDGFGRLIQTRAQAETELFGDEDFGNGTVTADQQNETATRAAVTGRLAGTDPHVTVSGWQVYDNKGQVVEQYEPFYSTGWAYQPPLDRQYGQKVEMYYDPRGQVVRTVNPDGSQQWVIYGVPNQLSQPGDFTPTPWEAYTYDANDLAPLSARTLADGTMINLATRVPAEHPFTPASIEIDALGRTVKAVERNGQNTATEEYITRSSYDIRGNLLTVTDALGRLSFRYDYDLANRPLRIWNVDAGLRRMVMDAVGNELERRDSKGALILQSYDAGNRPIVLRARDRDGDPVTNRQGFLYGDSFRPLSEAERDANNLRGQLYIHWDEAGQQTFEQYDFKGNLLTQQRQVLSDAVMLTGQPVDWSTDPALDPTVYETTMTYDGLSRVKTAQYPKDVEGNRKLLRPTYNRAGGLEQVTLDGQIYVERIAYNAKGQRTLIAYGNGVMTRYAYEADTFRLARLRTEGYEKTNALTYQPRREILQDMGYGYDLVGNILTIQDRTPRSGVAGTLQGEDALDRQFTYDPLYRLLSATGRESKGIGEPRPWTDDPREGFNQSNHGVPTQNNAPNQTQLYREDYTYDPAGNMLSLRHSSQKNNGWQVSWTRSFGMDGLAPVDWDAEWQQFLNGDWQNPRGNKLTHVEDRKFGVPSAPTVNQTHWFDVNGNLIQENQSRFFEWNHSDQLKQFRVQAGSGELSVQAFYCYDAAGQRVKKVVKKGSRVEVTVYVGGMFEHHRVVTPGETKENNSLHVMDDQQRIAILRVGKPFDNNVQTPAVQHHLGDHLGSSGVVIDEVGNWVNREEFFPYGETSFGGFGKKRYRFTGKERDEESGLNYHHARYYFSYLGRWISCDPLGDADNTRNIYLYVGSNPIIKKDPLGTFSGDIETFVQLIETSSPTVTASRLMSALPAVAIFIAITFTSTPVNEGEKRKDEKKYNLHHGTTEEAKKLILANRLKLGEGSQDDFGSGFYMTPSFKTAKKYAQSRQKYAQSRLGQETNGTVASVKFSEEDFGNKDLVGNVLDIRVGGKDREVFEEFLSQPLIPGHPLQIRDAYRQGEVDLEDRGIRFDAFIDFYKKRGGSEPDTVVGQLFTGISAGGPANKEGYEKFETEEIQVSFRLKSDKQAEALNKKIKEDTHWTRVVNDGQQDKN